MALAFPAPETSIAANTGWAAAKAPLAMKATFRGALVIRGRRLDGPGELGFTGDRGRRPYAALQFPANAAAIQVGTYKNLSITVWATTPGCYGLQIDGATFSRTIIFRVAST